MLYVIITVLELKKLEYWVGPDSIQTCVPNNIHLGPFKCYVTLFSWKFDPHPPPRYANNVELYTFVTLFSGKADTPPPPPTALHNT